MAIDVRRKPSHGCLQGGGARRSAHARLDKPCDRTGRLVSSLSADVNYERVVRAEIASAVVTEMPSGLADALFACLASTDVIVALYDEADVLRFFNEAYSRRFLRGRALPVPFADVLRHGFEHGFGVNVSSGDIDRFLADLQTRRRSTPFRAFAVDTVDGEWIWMTETLLPSGWLLSIGSDITSLKHNERTLRQAHEHALRAAKTDSLTGLCNRRHILQQAELLLGRCSAKALPYSIAMLDLDRFKQINDSLGHDGGDRVLRHFAVHCRAGVRGDDVVGRLGGEEFLVLLPEASAHVAINVMDRIRKIINAACADTPSLQAYTFSAGIAEAHANESLSHLLKRADLALYAAKTNGRNRSELG